MRVVSVFFVTQTQWFAESLWLGLGWVPNNDVYHGLNIVRMCDVLSLLTIRGVVFQDRCRPLLLR